MVHINNFLSYMSMIWIISAWSKFKTHMLNLPRKSAYICLDAFWHYRGKCCILMTNMLAMESWWTFIWNSDDRDKYESMCLGLLQCICHKAFCHSGTRAQIVRAIDTRLESNTLLIFLEPIIILVYILSMLMYW